MIKWTTRRAWQRLEQPIASATQIRVSAVANTCSGCLATRGSASAARSLTSGNCDYCHRQWPSTCNGKRLGQCGRDAWSHRLHVVPQQPTSYGLHQIQSTRRRTGMDKTVQIRSPVENGKTMTE